MITLIILNILALIGLGILVRKELNFVKKNRRVV